MPPPGALNSRALLCKFSYLHVDEGGASMEMAQPDFSDVLRRGIERCRQGDWEVGLSFLGRIAEGCRQGDWEVGLSFLGRIAEGERSSALPGLFYSYLGYGIALRQRRVQEGLKLCQHSVKIQFYEPENYVNLARTYLLAGDRPAAIRAVLDGLRVIRHHPDLLRLHQELGIRAQPVLPFLGRSNPLNRLLGRLRHAWQGDPPQKEETSEKADE
jgi:hypothetical protein